ncbi:MAG: shikimate dehydrogenase [Bacteroidales bacterium]|nr:shikimate dehydrogenase [Bacteroidales bacterium]
MIRQYGIIGYPLTHSRSPFFFNRYFKENNFTDCTYNSFPIKDISYFLELIQKNPNLYGLNVTSPYKQEVMQYLDEMDPLALKIGAVNTLKITHHNNMIRVKGYNTDADAFSESLKNTWGKDFSSALVFGTGGASRAACFALSQLGIPYQTVSRKATKASHTYEDISAELIKLTPLLINATPVGMLQQQQQQLPLPYAALTKQHYLFDMIYEPKESFFLSEGKKKGATIQNGEQMFIIQAKTNLKIWNF